MKKFTHTLILASLTTLITVYHAYGVFSQFVHIANGTEEKYNIYVHVTPQEYQKYTYRIKLPMLSEHMHCWLIICKDKIPPAKQNFRNYIWSETPDRSDIFVKAPISPTEDKEIQFVLNKDLVQKSYIYIDFSQPTLDGGFYYSIDLQTFLKETKQ